MNNSGFPAPDTLFDWLTDADWMEFGDLEVVDKEDKDNMHAFNKNQLYMTIPN